MRSFSATTASGSGFGRSASGGITVSTVSKGPTAKATRYVESGGVVAKRSVF